VDTGSRKPAGADDLARISPGELIHQHVRTAIELMAVHENLRAALGRTIPPSLLLRADQVIE